MAKMNNRNRNLLYNIIVFVVTIGLVVLSAYLGSKNNTSSNFLMILYYVLGAIVAGLLHVVFHELGHYFAGKRNKMDLLEIRFFCFDFKKVNGKMKFSFVLPLDAAGVTVMVPNGTENMLKRYKNQAFGGLLGSIILAVIGCGCMALVNFVPFVAFAFLGMILPITLYNLLSNMLPMTVDGFMNDGAVYFGAKHNDDSVVVASKMMEIEAELNAGKSYADIDEKAYFDFPQLPEDDLNFIVVLSNRYNYYLDKGDEKNALKVSERIFTLLEEMPKYMRKEVKKNFLYDASVITKNENEADDLADELTKVLNGDNTATGLRIKCAYLLYIVKDYQNVDKFLKQGLKQAKKADLKGQGIFETKLLNKMSEDLEVIAKTPMTLPLNDQTAQN